MDNLIKNRFFALIRSGLWGTDPDTDLFDTQTDWKQLFRLARAQSLSGIVFDGMQMLPPDKRPNRELYLQWCTAALQIEDNNRKLNRELSNVYALYRESGIEPVLLKGQGIGQNYRNPLHRECGDIDLYIGNLDYVRANELLRRESESEHEENHKHTCMEWHGVSIENHRVLTRLSSPSADRHFQKEVSRWSNNKQEYRNLTIDGCSVTLPPVNFDAAYILLHSVLHFFGEGIGLRQLCDWACLLRKQKEYIDHEEVEKLFRKWGLIKAAKAFGAITVKYLGLPIEDLPIAYTGKDLEKGEQLLDDILKTGNFGMFYTNQKQGPEEYRSSYWSYFTHICNRCFEFRSLAPAEAFWYPVLLAFFFAGIHGKKWWANVICRLSPKKAGIHPGLFP